MNKFSMVVCGGILGVTLVCQASDELTFTSVKPVADTTVMDISGVSRTALANALKLHDLMVEIRSLSAVEREVSRSVLAREMHEKKLSAMGKCSVNKLSKVFKDPGAVWDKMTTEYTQKEKDLAIYVNSSKTATEQEIKDFNAYMERGEMTTDVASEMLSQWQIGNEILTDVYANQDSWGERKSEDAPSFPIWEDQKYLFDKEWDKKYEAINLYFGVPPQGRPAIGDEKYDYAKADKLNEAHAAYLALLTTKNPVKGAALPPTMREAPIAPKPLPPKMEHLVYLESADPKKAIYPALPKPWREYEKGGFKDVSPKGEMREDFSAGLNLKEEAKKSMQTNRLTKYASLAQDVDGAKRYEAIVLSNATNQVAGILRKISEYIPVEDDINLINPDDREKVLQKLQEKYKTLLLEADIEMQARQEEHDMEIPTMDLSQIEDLAALKEINPEAFEELKTDIPNSMADRDKLLLKALKKDTEGRVFLNEVNAGDIDKMLKEAEAMRAFITEQDNMALKMYVSEPIDDTCLNGGI